MRDDVGLGIKVLPLSNVRGVDRGEGRAEPDEVEGVRNCVGWRGARVESLGRGRRRRAGGRRGIDGQRARG